ncbi:MAG: D-alanine--D-alanine ligase [Planctomycetota bacterium]
MTTLNITVLAGGPSDEREVSLNSGKAVYGALARLGHRVVMRDISPDDLSALHEPADCIFIALHGAFGEDGQLQRILERGGKRYCGCDSASSALAMDKVEAKKRFVTGGIPTPRFDVVKKPRIAAVVAAWPLPAVVKPVRSGSSVDTSIVRERSGLADTLNAVVSKHGDALIEQYIDGPELTVGLLDGRPLPPLQIRPKRAFYDYRAKYLDDDTEYLFDIDLPVEVLEHVQELSVRAHDALGCRDFCRVDWMVDHRTHEPFVLEINTIPGFTGHSLLPKAAARVGISFDELCQRIVMMAMRR